MGTGQGAQGREVGGGRGRSMDEHPSLPSNRRIILGGVSHTSQELLAMVTLTMDLMLVFPPHFTHHIPHICFLGFILNNSQHPGLCLGLLFSGGVKAESFIGEKA